MPTAIGQKTGAIDVNGKPICYGDKVRLCAAIPYRARRGEEFID